MPVEAPWKRFERLQFGNLVLEQIGAINPGGPDQTEVVCFISLIETGNSDADKITSATVTVVADMFDTPKPAARAAPFYTVTGQKMSLTVGQAPVRYWLNYNNDAEAGVHDIESIKITVNLEGVAIDSSAKPKQIIPYEPKILTAPPGATGFEPVTFGCVELDTIEAINTNAANATKAACNVTFTGIHLGDDTIWAVRDVSLDVKVTVAAELFQEADLENSFYTITGQPRFVQDPKLFNPYFIHYFNIVPSGFDNPADAIKIFVHLDINNMSTFAQLSPLND